MNFPENWALWFSPVWVVLFGTLLFQRWRRLRGRPGGLVEPPAEALVFDEAHASARSHQSWRTRHGGGNRCMRISLTNTALLVRPHFPFSLAGDAADLVHEIPLAAVTEVAAGGREWIAVRFEPDRRVDISLKRKAEFRAALGRGVEAAKRG